MPKTIAGTENPAYTDWKLDSSGSYGSVYTVREVATGKNVAIKEFMLSSSDSIRRDTIAEISLLRGLSNPHIISVLDVFTAGSGKWHYMVMPLMDATLQDLIRQTNASSDKLEPLLIKSYMQQLLHGLAYLHSLNILHRDLKPTNLLIDKEGLLQICDFGLAIEIEPDRAQQTPLTRQVRSLC
jgi:serine/threonine protein kinase